MKKLMIMALIVASMTTYGEVATLRVEGKDVLATGMRSWTPLSLNVITPVGLPWGSDWDVYGFQIGFYNSVENFGGLQLGLLNVTDDFSGLQLGLINVTRKIYGLQVGIVNVIEDNDVPFLPIVNCYF
jgi:hypothetical protein